jgi:hypothetical protein
MFQGVVAPENRFLVGKGNQEMGVEDKGGKMLGLQFRTQHHVTVTLIGPALALGPILRFPYLHDTLAQAILERTA